MNDAMCESIIADMTKLGWILEFNNEKYLKFTKPVNEKVELFRDYNKKTGNFVQGNIHQVVSIVSTYYENTKVPS